jgi:hypothetical protein
MRAPPQIVRQPHTPLRAPLRGRDGMSLRPSSCRGLPSRVSDPGMLLDWGGTLCRYMGPGALFESAAKRIGRSLGPGEGVDQPDPLRFRLLIEAVDYPPAGGRAVVSVPDVVPTVIEPVELGAIDLDASRADVCRSAAVTQSSVRVTCPEPAQSNEEP